MADKFFPCGIPYDELALLVEILRTLRHNAGLEPGEYSEQKGGLTIPDDLKAKKPKKDKEPKG